MRFYKYIRFWLILLLPITLILRWVAINNPNIVEEYYSRGIYPVLSSAFAHISSAVPISVAQILAFLIICFGIIYLTKFFRNKKGVKRKTLQIIFDILTRLLACVAAGYFVFVAVCGLNYYRLSFASQSGLEVLPSSANELAQVGRELIATANRVRERLPDDDAGGIKSSFDSNYQLSQFAQQSYSNIAAKYEVFAGYSSRPKPLLGSKAMSYMQLGGVYIPFTFEPSYNNDVPKYSIPATVMHEISHYKGFMREDEANYLAFLACIYSENDEFVYSGVMLGITYVTNALYTADKELFWEVIGEMSEKVRGDIAQNSSYWADFEGPVAEVSTSVNNAYLQSNNQSSGVKSYGAMVDLLMAQYRKEGNVTQR